MQYRDGQIYLAQASTLIEGFGTEFLTYCKAGDRLFIRNESVSYVIEDVIGNDKLRLSAPYRKTSKTTDYSVQLDYSAHFRLMMPYLGDFNVEDMLRLNIGKLDAMLAAACSGAGVVAGNPYRLEIVSFAVSEGDNPASRRVHLRLNSSHNQSVDVKIILDNTVIADWSPLVGVDYDYVLANIAYGNHTITAEIKDAKGNHKSASSSVTITAGGVLIFMSPNSGAWTFTPAAGRVGGRVDSTENNVLVGMELIHGGGLQQPWTEQKARLQVPTGEVVANEGTDFPGYPVKLKVWNLSRQELWRWDDANTATLEAGGSGNIGAGGFTLAAAPVTPTLSGDEYQTGWTATASEAGVLVSAELYQWGVWQDWYKPQINLDQNTATLSSAFWSGRVPAGAFPFKYRLKNASKTATLTYASATAAAVLDEQLHAGGGSNPDAITEITSITQLAATQNAQLEFKVLSNHTRLATEWLIEVDGQAVTAWVAAAFNQESTVTHTLTDLAVGARAILVRGRGASVTDNSQTTAITITSSAVDILAPELSNFVITPGPGSATFALDVSDTRPVEYTIFRDGVEIFPPSGMAPPTAINQQVDNLPAGAASFYIRVSNDASKQATTAHQTATLAAPDAGAATITNLASAIDTVDGIVSVDITALVDVPDQSNGIHYRVYRYLTGDAPPTATDAARGGFDWIEQPADFSPGAIEKFFPHAAENYTYALDAKPQGAVNFATDSVAVAGQVGVDTITVVVDSTSAVDDTSYNIKATLSNSLSEAMEYRISQGGTEKVAWTTHANATQFDQTISAAAGTYAVVIEARTASIAVVSESLSVTVNAASSGGTGNVSPGSQATQGPLKVTFDAIAWTADPVVFSYTPEIVNVSPAGLSVWVAYKPQWSNDFGTFYEKTPTVLSTHSSSGLASGDTLKFRFELRDSASAVLARIDSVDLIKP